MRSAPPLARERREVELRQGVLDELALVVVGQRLARDLLGREDREVGDLVADLLARAPRLGLDLALGGLEHLFALALTRLQRGGLGGVRGLAGAVEDLLGLLARLREGLAVLPAQVAGPPARVAGPRR